MTEAQWAEIISIHVPRERDDFHEPDELPGGFFISIHVPRERDDWPGLSPRTSRHVISIHVPRERDDRLVGNTMIPYDVFQSTSLVRGTTRSLPPTMAAG